MTVNTGLGNDATSASNGAVMVGLAVLVIGVVWFTFRDLVNKDTFKGRTYKVSRPAAPASRVIRGSGGRFQRVAA